MQNLTLNKRFLFIDILRSSAIIMMFITHTARLITFHNDNNIIQAFFDFFMMIEPIIAAIFLFISGYSLRLTFQNNQKWYSKKNKIIKNLFIWSILLHAIQYGILIDQLIFSSGILFVIAISILITYKQINNNEYLFFLTIIFSIIYQTLIYLKLNIVGLNAGTGALLPSINYFIFGVLSFNLKNLIEKVKFIFPLIILLIIGFDAKLVYFPSHNTFDLINLKWKLFEVWNPSLLGQLFNISILIFLSINFNKFLISKDNFIAKFSNNSLFLYKYHLIIIGLMYQFKIGIPSATEALIFLILLISIGTDLMKRKNYLSKSQ